MDNIQNGLYKIGDAKWDDGFCTKCNAIMSDKERHQAALNMLANGMMYWCGVCTKAFFTKNERTYK